MLGQIFINGILAGGVYALVALGLTLIFGVMRIINFAHGEFLMLAMYATFWLFQVYALDPYVSIVVVVPLMFLVGIIAYRLIIQPIIDAPEMAQVFATLGLSIALQSLALLLWEADFRAVRTSYSAYSLYIGPYFVNLTRLIAFMFAIATMLFLFFFLQKTYMGKAIRAAAQNGVAAQLMGVNLKRIYMTSFGIGISVVSLAGAVLVPMYEVFPTVGSFFILMTFVVVVLGGIGSLHGAVVAGLIIGLIEAASGFFLAPVLKDVVYFVIFVLILLLRPAGLFGKTA